MFSVPSDAHVGLAAHSRLRNEGENTMRIFLSLTRDRLGGAHLALGAETLLALTLCLLIVRAVTQI